MQRRQFLQKGALAVGALCTPFVSAVHAAAGDAARRTALGFIGSYSDNFLVLREGAGVTRLVALVRDIPSFSAAFHGASGAGIANLRVAGTVATFRARGQLFEVDNLMQQDFAALNA